MGQQILKVANATADRGGIGCAKLVVFANIPQDVPFMAGAYLGVGEPDVVINVGVSGPGVVKKALDRAREAGHNGKGGRLTLLDMAEVIKRTAYKVTRVGEMIGTEVATRLGLPFGVADLSLAPTPAVGDSVGEIFQSMSAETRANAEHGANIVESALQSIGQVHKVSLALKGDMTTLHEHAQAITHIMKLRESYDEIRDRL